VADAILIVGLAWWFGATYFGTQHRIRNAGGSGSLLGGLSTGALYVVGGVASLSMIALALSASARFAATDAGFGPFVFGAILCAVAAGCTLGAAHA
jgi:hypothetical protein